MKAPEGHPGLFAAGRRVRRNALATRQRMLSTTPRPSHRLLRMLDCLLLLLVLLIVIGDPSTARAGTEAFGGNEIPAAAHAAPFEGRANGALNVQRGGAPPDAITLAAVIAAENSALTPPLYFVDLPLINR
jgi:hypothetical protein